MAVAVSLGGWWWTSRATAEPPPAAQLVQAAPEMASQLVTVHVAGEVVRPGVVVLPPGARVADAIEAAGGATASAVLAAVNLAAVVSDGSQITVPALAPLGSSPQDDGLLTLNTATVVELDGLPGIGPVLAERIVSYREQHGPFATVEDLLDVSGIGESILGRLRPHLRVP